MTYHALEKQVYDWLLAKHNQDHNFTFSLRQNGNVGARRDYFIGTEKSNYFGMTFWTIPVAYPGSSSDLINVFFLINGDEIAYELKFNQTKSPYNEQNQQALNLITKIKESIRERFGLEYETKAEHAMQIYTTKKKRVRISEIDQLLSDLSSDLNTLFPIVDEAIDEIKADAPDFAAERISQDNFKRMQDKMERRFTKYASIPENSEEPTQTTSGQLEKEEAVKRPLNQIFYGAPGTGKTYETINEAIRICNPEFDLNQDRSVIKKEYQRLSDEGQIVFTTFHQSTSYEDFIEGIKPQVGDNGQMGFEVESGVFKQLCQRAKTIKSGQGKLRLKGANFFKMSLGGRNKLETHNWCIDNNVIGLGWGGGGDLSKYRNIEDWKDFREQYTQDHNELMQESRFHAQAAFIFLRIKKNDIVIISKGNKVIDAIGIVKDDYFWSDEAPIDYVHFRKVEWIAKNMNTTPDRFLRKNISQQAIYEFSHTDIKVDAIKALGAEIDSRDNQNFALIIDEINRGNVSQIFGELITLIETDKRIGNREEITLILPYSKDQEAPFGVPNNLYIIGTMNTADRSVEALDNALRRRFSFKEITPDHNVIAESGSLSEDNGILLYHDFEIDLPKILEIINVRIERLLDKDHTIGHSYFLSICSLNDLKIVFAQKIIPLLQEYFYGDYGKIALILGEGFCSPYSTGLKMTDIFAQTTNYNGDIFTDKAIYRIQKPERMTDDIFVKGLKKLMNISLEAETDADHA